MSKFNLLLALLLGNFCLGHGAGGVPTTKEKIEELQRKFKDLVRQMKEILIESDRSGKLSFDGFREDFIFDIPESIKDSCQYYFEKKSSSVYKARDYDSLFLIFNGVWDYLNPSLLEHFIHKYGQSLIPLIDDYIGILESFMSITEVGMFWKAQPPVEHKLRCPPNFCEVVTKHALSCKCTLQCVDNIRIELCEELSLKRFALYIAKLKAGSLFITWYVTSQVAKMLHKETEQLYYSILSIICEDYSQGE